MEKDAMCCARCIMWKCSDLDVEAEIESDRFDGSVFSKCLHLNENERADNYCEYFIEVL